MAPSYGQNQSQSLKLFIYLLLYIFNLYSKYEMNCMNILYAMMVYRGQINFRKKALKMFPK